MTINYHNMHNMIDYSHAPDPTFLTVILIVPGTNVSHMHTEDRTLLICTGQGLAKIITCSHMRNYDLVVSHAYYDPEVSYAQDHMLLHTPDLVV